MKQLESVNNWKSNTYLKCIVVDHNEGKLPFTHRWHPYTTEQTKVVFLWRHLKKGSLILYAVFLDKDLGWNEYSASEIYPSKGEVLI
jgi:hypothetical protein